jgi:hypothetical protein
MTRTERIAGALLVACLFGCDARVGPAALPAPRPTAVEPAAGLATTDTAITVAGEPFPARAVQSVSSGGSEVDARYRAWLDATELPGVVWVDAGTLRARVPAGLPVGRHDLVVEGPSGRGVLASAYEVISGAPAALGASMSVPGSASVGRSFDVVFTVTNLGDTLVTAVTLQVATSGTGAVAHVAAAFTQDVPPGEARTFVSRYRADAPGDVTFSGSAMGSDPRTGSAVSATASGTVVLEGSAELMATLSIPAGPIAIGDFPVTLTLANAGELVALGVATQAPSLAIGCTGAAVLVSGPAVGATLPPGDAATYTWTYRAVASGTLQLQAGVTWTDANGTPRAATAVSNTASVPQRVDVLAADPFADGSPFAHVAGYRGQVYVGPSRNGAGIVRMQLDGTAPESLVLAFAQDRTGNASTNTAPPYTSIGSTGCTPSSATCGPDNEDGRGLLTSVTFGGDEWLLVGGARSGGELDYVYLSRATTSPLAFSYVDLGSLLGAATRGFTAAQVVGDRLYLGFADNGGSRPYGVALLAAPSVLEPNIEAVDRIDAFELGLHTAYDGAYHAFTTISMIDAIAELNGHVYFFNNSGCLGSRTTTPQAGADFFPCSPTPGLDYDVASAVDPPRQYDLEPRDRAWPQVAVWNGRLFAIRNTSTGPQLWGCQPGRRGDPLVCDPSDWHLVAADATYRTRLGKATATAASLLVATPTHLFFGLDDATGGVHLFRTAAADPAAASDFTGRDGCLAGTTGCEGIGGDGFGAPGRLVRIFDAKAIPTSEGHTDVYLTTGDGIGPVHVIRVLP